MELAAVRLEDGLFARLADEVVYLGLRLVVHLLDARRMDAAVLEQLLKRQLRDLSANAVERGEDDRLRGVVDDEVDAGQVLERADVAALASDDAPLHVVGRQLDDRHCRLCGMARGHALERIGDEVACSPAGIRLCLLVELANAAGELVADELLRAGEHLAPSPRRVRPAIRSSSRAPAPSCAFNSS